MEYCAQELHHRDQGGHTRGSVPCQRGVPVVEWKLAYLLDEKHTNNLLRFEVLTIGSV
jgi:hypothetical protein